VTSPSPEPAALAPRRKVRRRKFEQWFGPKGAGIVEWIVVIVGAVVLALVVKVFLLQAFYIPSLSMYPTLDKGDRGDIIVFERPPSEAPSDIPDLIKRVIGLPGEAVAFENGSVYINGERLPESYLPDGTTTTAANAPNNCTTTSPCIVPSGQVWVMGDNRGDSKDSRYFGAIPESSIVGRAFILVWPFSRFGLL
jgi:signal peptidase I